MKVAATFLLSVAVFAALFLESSTNIVDIVDKVVDGVEAVVEDVANAVGAAGKDGETVKQATNTVTLVPTERVIASINAIKGEVKGALDVAANKIECTLRRELLVKAVKEQVKNVFIINNAALDNIITAVTEGLAKAKGADKDSLTLVVNWLNPLVELSTSVENTMNDALDKDTTEDLQNAITVLNQAIVDADENLAKFVKTLEGSSSKHVKSVKTVIKNNMDSILVYANDNLTALKSLLPGVLQGCNAAA